MLGFYIVAILLLGWPDQKLVRNNLDILESLAKPLHRHKIGVWQVIPPGGILDLAHRIQPVTIVSISKSKISILESIKHSCDQFSILCLVD